MIWGGWRVVRCNVIVNFGPQTVEKQLTFNDLLCCLLVQRFHLSTSIRTYIFHEYTHTVDIFCFAIFTVENDLRRNGGQ